MTALTAQEGTDAASEPVIAPKQKRLHATTEPVIAPKQKRLRVKKDKSHLNEEARLGADIKSWTSSVYAHFDAPMIVKKEEVEGGKKKEVMNYRFTCKEFKDHEVDRKRDGLSDSHMGRYLAGEIAKVLEWYGIDGKCIKQQHNDFGTPALAPLL
ncbi:hypothetical protein BT69DRAFT_1336220 [Atractiella rhizophila]|nr:hypothetical protein BT69DRAFT_1336220 [Atractiella rhizophila]